MKQSTLDTPAHPEPRRTADGDQCWTMAELRDEIDRFAAMLRTSDKRHGTIASYVTQAERFLNWLEGSYTPRARRLGRPYGWQVSEESRTKYRPLREYLQDRPEYAVRMTFREIERVLQTKLPASAWVYAQWWANDRTGNHTQAHAWLSSNRKVTQLNLLDGLVTFRKTAPRPQARPVDELTARRPGG